MSLVVPDPRIVVVGAANPRNVEVRVLTVGKVLQISQLFKEGKLEKLPAGADVFDWIEVLPEEMVRLTMIATGLDREEINEASVDQFVELLSTVLDMNRDFFFRAVGPRLRELLVQVTMLAGITGQLRFNTSSGKVTASLHASATPSPSSSPS